VLPPHLCRRRQVLALAALDSGWPDGGNGVRKRSQVMVDKAQTVPREKVGEPFGRLDDTTMLSVTRALAVFLGFA
jgi:mRNA interferase MazF